MIIAFTTGFVHRMVYKYGYKPDHNFDGYVNFTLSYFNVSDFPEDERYIDKEGKFKDLKVCR